LSNRVFKNYQVNLGIPFQVKIPPGLRNISVDNEDEGDNAEGNRNEKTDEDNHESIIRNAREEADLIIKEAEYEASRIIETAKERAEEDRKSVLEDAWKEGYEKGTNEGKGQYETIIKEAEKIKQQADREYKEILSSMETDVMSLVIDVARKVMCTEILTNRDCILNMVREAFEKSTNKESTVLYINPHQFEIAKENKEKLISMVEGLNELEIKMDPSLKSGDFFVKTPYGNVNCSMEKRLKMIEEAFKELI
jgi:flagellar assembly protein FliH